MQSKLIMATVLAGTCFMACSEDSDSVAGLEEDSGIVAALDTVIVHDSVKVRDTVNIRDTISLRDTLKVRDTVDIHDTVKVRDTLNVHDTVTVHDSVNVHDTVEVSKAVALTGVAQKGPFVAGSEISVYTLVGSEGIGEKGVTIGNVVTEDDGSYSVDGVSLSTRVGVSVNGLYHEELRPEVAPYKLTLRAVAELGGSQANVNVNVATELEYDRVDYLLRNNPEMTFDEAKKQAQKEVFGAFGIDASGFANSENLNILGSGEGDAALLAVSMIIETVRKYGGYLPDFLKSLSSDILEDGVMDDEVFLQQAAYDMMQLDLHGSLDGVEKNVESWTSGADLGGFQKYIRQFWQGVLGFDECGSAAAPEGSTFEFESSTYKCEDGRWKYDAELSGVETFTDGRDGQTYKMVTIGGQTWMAENLNYDLNLEQEDGSVKKFSWCGGGDSASVMEGDCSVYGRFYTWAGTLDSVGKFSDGAKGCGDGVSCSLEKIRGICPEGWHLPSNDEWNTLFESVGGPSTAGLGLKATRGWLGFFKGGVFVSGNGTDDVGFSAVPAGLATERGYFYDVGHEANFVSTTELSEDRAYYMLIRDNSDAVEMYAVGKGDRFSVRCVRD